jgi:hypothetical protein
MTDKIMTRLLFVLAAHAGDDLLRKARRYL